MSLEHGIGWEGKGLIVQISNKQCYKRPRRWLSCEFFLWIGGHFAWSVYIVSLANLSSKSVLLWSPEDIVPSAINGFIHCGNWVLAIHSSRSAYWTVNWLRVEFSKVAKCCKVRSSDWNWASLPTLPYQCDPVSIEPRRSSWKGTRERNGTPKKDTLAFYWSSSEKWLRSYHWLTGIGIFKMIFGVHSFIPEDVRMSSLISFCFTVVVM